jgi:hypothetical protein
MDSHALAASATSRFIASGVHHQADKKTAMGGDGIFLFLFLFLLL